MIRFGVLSLIVSGLQLIVPPYALRLLRRYGAQRVGWFLVTAFMTLAMMHLLEPVRPLSGATSASSVGLQTLAAIGSVLLLIGMSHLETLFTERGRVKNQEESLRGTWESRVQEKTKACQDLAQELTRQQESEAAIIESEAQYRLLFTENPQPMLIYDLRTLRFLAANKAALQQYGFSAQEFTALTAKDLLPDETAGAFLKQATQPCSRAEYKGLWRHRRKDRTLLDVEITAQDMKYAGYPARLMLAHDISERRRREMAARESVRMDTFKQLAGGAAHHFNNLLAVIDGYANLLVPKQADPQSAEHLKHICAAANRAAAITRQLSAAAGRQLIQTEVMNLNGVILNLSPMLRRLIGPTIVMQNSSYSSLPAILADPRVVEHILVNLVLNARDAMPRGGTVTISTATIRVDEAQAQRNYHAQVGEFVCLSVSDTGSGMTPEVQAHIFEPFFTTRDTGKGTGLGLASVYGLVTQHSGWVEFSSEPGVGTEFRIFLPVAPAAALHAKKDAPKQAPTARETILLVEPVERVRGLARYILNRQGYRVIEADSTPGALLLWEKQASQVDLVLTEVNLPGRLTGPALAKQLSQTRPNLKVLFTSGCESSTGAEAENLGLPADSRFVPKPFSPDKLLRAVQECLAKAA
jgi:two-component system cell cycle sensor histidine kinase/response regulator CckA